MMFSLRKLQIKVERLDQVNASKKKESKKLTIPTFLSLAGGKAKGKYSLAENIIQPPNLKDKKGGRFFNRIDKNDDISVHKKQSARKTETQMVKNNSMKRKPKMNAIPEKKTMLSKAARKMQNSSQKRGRDESVDNEEKSFDLHKPLKKFKRSTIGKSVDKEIPKKNSNIRLRNRKSLSLISKANPKKSGATSKSKKEISKDSTILSKKKKLIKESVEKENSSDNRGVMDFDSVEFPISDSIIENPNNPDNGLSNEGGEIPYFYQNSYSEGPCNYVHKPYIATKRIDKNSSMIILRANSKLYLQGYYYLKLLLGDIRVLGYKFNKLERRSIFCPPTNCILPIEALEGESSSLINKKALSDLNIPLYWSKYFPEGKNASAVVILVERYFSSLTSFLKETKSLKIKHQSLDRNILHHIEASIVKPETLKTLKYERSWDVYVDELEKSYKKGTRLVLVICGGKSVGKSTFLRFMANRILNFTNVTQVGCLDLDPGQSEFSIPGSISLCRFSTPLLGPSFMNVSKKYTYKKDIFYGEISVVNALPEYISIVRKLVEDSSEDKEIPLIINTMGFVQNSGIDIIVDIMRITNPTRVINLESTDPKNNFAYRPDSEFVNLCKYGISTKNSDARVNYDISYLQLAGGGSRFTSDSRLKRELQVISYLSALWKEAEGRILGDTCKSPIIIKWDSVAIHAFSSSVSMSHILQVLNGSLIALCHVTDSALETLGPSLPRRIQKESRWIQNNICQGYGIVQGIDPLKMEIHILTPLNEDEVLNNVNALIIPKIGLPEKIFNFFTSDESPSPYLQCMKR